MWVWAIEQHYSSEQRNHTNTEENSEITHECAFCNTSHPSHSQVLLLLLLLPPFFSFHLLVFQLSIIASHLLALYVCVRLWLCTLLLFYSLRRCLCVCTQNVATSFKQFVRLCVHVCTLLSWICILFYLSVFLCTAHTQIQLRTALFCVFFAWFRA